MIGAFVLLGYELFADNRDEQIACIGPNQQDTIWLSTAGEGWSVHTTRAEVTEMRKIHYFRHSDWKALTDDEVAQLYQIVLDHAGRHDD